jgi:type I restriction-modification system DNA methylase subunit
MDKLSETHFSGFFNYRGKLWENAKASTLNAHFTSPDIISLIYQAIEQMGYRKGTLLEPSMGTGNFFGMIPDNIVERTKLYGVELDPLTGSIAQLLYPNADIRIQGFQDVNYPDNYFDVAVGNVPFGNYKIADNKYPSFVTERIHNYFFAKTLDVVKPG